MPTVMPEVGPWEKNLLEGRKRRLDGLDRERSSWIPAWRDVGDYLLQRRSRFLGEKPNVGSKRVSKVINNTGTRALRVLASGMMAGISSPARKWFRLVTPDPTLMDDDEVRLWLAMVEDRIFEVYHRSNTYNALASIYETLPAMGVAAALVAEDYDEIIRVYVLPTGSFYLANSDRMRVNTCYRQTNMTVHQLMMAFGDSCSTFVKDAYKRKDWDDWVPIIHAVEPNPDADPQRKGARFKPYLSVYFEQKATERVLSVSGFDNFPVLAPRWAITGEDVYGSSCPGFDAIEDIKSLQLLERKRAHVMEKIVNPVMNAPSGLREAKISLLPGDVNYTTGMGPGSMLSPAYEIPPQALAIRDEIVPFEQRINATFLADLFLSLTMMDRSGVTAREVDERHEEKMLQLGPVLERVQDELLDPLIDITFEIGQKRGIFPPPPEQLANVNLRVEYISILAQAQKLLGVSAIERLSGYATALAAVKPEVFDKIDIDKTVSRYAHNLGIDPDLIKSQAAVDAIRKQRAEQERAMALAASAKPVSDAASAAKTLSETQVGGQSALDRIAAGMGAQQA